MGKNQDSGGQGWGASFLTQTTEDVARAVVAAAATVRPRPSVVFSTKYQNSNNQLQKLQRQVSKVWKGCPFPGDGKKAVYNPELLTSQKRQWTRLQLQALERKHRKEPTKLVENVVVVGLHPNTDVQAIEVSLTRKRAMDRETESSERLRDVLRHQHRGVCQPNLEPQILFAYPPEKRLPLKYKDLLSFCFPGGLEAHLVERTPSMSELNEIILGQEHLKRNDLSFVFRLKVADNATLYGCCMVVEELVQKPPGLMPVHAEVPLFHSSLRRFLVSAPRCYCILSKMPFFSLHFGVLKSIFTQERLERITASINELNLASEGRDTEEKYESSGLVKSQADHAAEAAVREGTLVKKACAEGSATIEGSGPEHEKCFMGDATENRVLMLSSEPKQMEQENGGDQCLQVKSEAAMHHVKGTSLECSETSGEAGSQGDKCSMGDVIENRVLLLPSEPKGMNQENRDQLVQVKFGSEYSEQLCNKDNNEPQEEISDCKVLEASARNGEVVSSNTNGEISSLVWHRRNKGSDSLNSIQVFSNNNFEEHIRSMNLDDEACTEEASPSGQENTNASDAILAWAKANNHDSLRIVCEYCRLPFPLRGSSLVFQPLEHLQPLTFHRSGDTDLKSTVDFSSCKSSLEIAEAHATLFAEEEAGALAIWTTATVCGVLPLESVLVMLSAVLLEKQIVVLCSNLGVLSAVVLSVIPLIRPFQWQCLLLPVLPNSMLEFLDAPVPYIVGVRNKSPEVRTKLPNVILVDVNKSQVRTSSVPQLPQHKELLSALGPYHAKLVAESYLAKKRPVHEYNDAQAQAVEGFLAVLRSYLESICTNLRAHTITNVQSNDDKVSLLLKESFVESFSNRDRPFMKLFVDTQLFSVHTDAVLSSYQKE